MPVSRIVVSRPRLSSERSAPTLCRPSIPPNSPMVRSTRSRTDRASARSNSIAMALPPDSVICAAAAVAPSILISPIATRAPSSARRLAVAAPIPVAPPATRNVLSFNPRITGSSHVSNADVDRNLGCGHQSRLVGGQPRDGIGDVFGLRDTFGQQRLVQAAQVRVVVGGRLQRLAHPAGTHRGATAPGFRLLTRMLYRPSSAANARAIPTIACLLAV